MAPVRVVYEVAKRSGAHGAMLRGFVGRAKSRDLVRLERFGPQVEVPDAARERTLADARLIVTEGHRAFGHRFPVNQAQAWNQLPLTALSWPAAAYWWDLARGRAPCRDRVCQYGMISVVAVALKKKKPAEHTH